MLSPLLLEPAAVRRHVQVFLVYVACGELRRLGAGELLSASLQLLPFFNRFGILIILEIAILAFTRHLLLINPIHWISTFPYILVRILKWRLLLLPLERPMRKDRPAGFGCFRVDVLEHIQACASLRLFLAGIFRFETHDAFVICV